MARRKRAISGSRIARFLDIQVTDELPADLAEAASLSSMRSDAKELAAALDIIFDGGGDRFLYEDTNRRWEIIFGQDDLQLYVQKDKQHFTPQCAL